MALNWICKNGSAILVLILVLIGVVFSFVGNSLSNNTTTWVKISGIVLIQFSTTLIVAAVATIFFSLRDIKESMVRIASQLLANSKVIPFLSKEAKDRLEESIVFDRLRSTVSRLQPDLYNVVTLTRDKYLNTFHLQNFHEEVIVSPHPSNPAFVHRESTRTFKVIPYHLENSQRTFSLCYHLEIGVSKDIPISKEEFLINFEVKAGDNLFGLADAVVKESTSGSLGVMLMDFNRRIEVKESLAVRISSRCLGWADDNVDIFRMRYPTNGFTLSYRYLESLQYDAAWFKLFKVITPKAGFKLDKADIHPHSCGITAVTQDWVLPGEGVAISWHPSKPTAIEST
jgi:hypothetical protein